MAVFHKWGTWVQVICNDLETLPEHRSRNWKCSRSIWVLWPWQALVRSQSNPEEDWWSLGPSFLGSSEPHNSCRRDMFHQFHLHPSRLCSIPCTLQGLQGHCQASLHPHQSCTLQITKLGLWNLGGRPATEPGVVDTLVARLVRVDRIEGPVQLNHLPPPTGHLW